ncbi:hypothetical protein LguiB_018193 [Lonicera macranthoides]
MEMMPGYEDLPPVLKFAVNTIELTRFSKIRCVMRNQMKARIRQDSRRSRAFDTIVLFCNSYVVREAMASSKTKPPLAVGLPLMVEKSTSPTKSLRSYKIRSKELEEIRGPEPIRFLKAYTSPNGCRGLRFSSSVFGILWDQPVSTIAAYDHASEEVLNCDQSTLE